MASVSIIPYAELVDFVKSIDLDRAQSLEFRFMHEKLLVAHVQEKFFIGWGSWSRNRFFDSVTDGYWLIVFSRYGVIAFWAMFGLILQPLVKLALQRSDRASPYSLTLGVLLAFLLLDQIPNSSFSFSLLWYLTGCLAGYVYRIPPQHKKTSESLAWCWVSSVLINWPTVCFTNNIKVNNKSE